MRYFSSTREAVITVVVVLILIPPLLAMMFDALEGGIGTLIVSFCWLGGVASFFMSGSERAKQRGDVKFLEGALELLEAFGLYTSFVAVPVLLFYAWEYYIQ